MIVRHHYALDVKIALLEPHMHWNQKHMEFVSPQIPEMWAHSLAALSFHFLKCKLGITICTLLGWFFLTTDLF